MYGRVDDYPTMHLSILLLVGQLSYFQIFVLINNVAKTFLDMLLGEHIHIFLLGIYVAVELLSHSTYEFSVWTAKVFFKVHVPIYILTNSM